MCRLKREFDENNRETSKMPLHVEDSSVELRWAQLPEAGQPSPAFKRRSKFPGRCMSLYPPIQKNLTKKND